MSKRKMGIIDIIGDQKMRRCTFVLILLLCLVAQNSLAREYRIDDQHSKIRFRVNVGQKRVVRGHFESFSGVILWPEQSEIPTSIAGHIRIRSIDTGHRIRDKWLRSGLFFALRKYPLAEFKSTRIWVMKTTKKKGQKRPPKSIMVEGILNFNGKEKALRFPVLITTRPEWSGHQQIGLRASVLIQQDIFNLPHFMKPYHRISRATQVTLQTEAVLVQEKPHSLNSKP